MSATQIICKINKSIIHSRWIRRSSRSHSENSCTETETDTDTEIVEHRQNWFGIRKKSNNNNFSHVSVSFSFNWIVQFSTLPLNLHLNKNKSANNINSHGVFLSPSFKIVHGKKHCTPNYGELPMCLYVIARALSLIHMSESAKL